MNEIDRATIVSYRIQRANETLKEIDFLIEKNFLNTAINRLYYSCYYAVIAILIKEKIETNTHAGVRLMFGKKFIKTGKIPKELGKFYSDIFDKRQTGDYDDLIEFSREDIIQLLPTAKIFIQTIENLINERKE